MGAFTPAEVAYSRSRRLGRLATAGANSQPHVVPVGFRSNAKEDTIDVGGHNVAQSKKYRAAPGNPRVAFVVDEIVSAEPWRVRMIDIRGEAEILPTGGNSGLAVSGFADPPIRIIPRRIAGLGIDGDDWTLDARSVP
jgi:pyridoxamine 5'-phosphate oxidase family protein